MDCKLHITLAIITKFLDKCNNSSSERGSILGLKVFLMLFGITAAHVYVNTALMKINLHTIRNDSLLGTLKFVSKTKDCQQYGALIHDDMINKDVKDAKAYKTYYDFATGKDTPKKARKFKKVASPSRKLSLILEEEPAEKPKRAKKLDKKSTTMPTAGITIRDTPSESVPRSKHQLKLIEEKAWIYFMMWHYLKLLSSRKASWKLISFMQVAQGDSGDDDDDNDDDSDEVTKDDDEDDVKSDADDDKEASDSKKTDSDKDENLNLNQNDDEEEEKEEEYVRTPDSFKFNDDDEECEELYKDVNVRLTNTEHEEQGKKDEEMTNASRDYKFEKKAKEERKRYIDLVKKYMKEIIKDEVKNQLLEILPKEVSDYTTPVIQNSITELLENIVLAKSSSQHKSTYKAAALLTKFELKKILLDKIQKSKLYQCAQEHKDLYDALVKSYKLDKDLFESYGKVYTLKRDQEDKDNYEDPPTGSDQGLKKQKTSKDVKPSREELMFETIDTKMPLNQGEYLGNTDNQPNVKEALKDDWFKKPKRPSTPDLDWDTTKMIDFRPP
nr:hypothetical protein [Tanacetum cinerariifolium]